MRNIIIEVTCDACGDTRPEDGDITNVEFTVQGETREIDFCGSCLQSHLLDTSRPVVVKKVTRKPRPSARSGPGGSGSARPAQDEGPFQCAACPRTFATLRGRSKHENASH